MSKKEKSIKVLIIDDDKRIRSTIKLFLGKEEYNVLMAADGKKGLRLAKRKFPDVILLDIMMPEMDGIEVLKGIKQDSETCHIPVIMLTGLDGEEMISRAMHEYAQQYIVKPFGKEMLEDAIKKALHR